GLLLQRARPVVVGGAMPDLDDVPAERALDGLEDLAGLQARLEDRVTERLVEVAGLGVLRREVRQLAAGARGAVITLRGLLVPLGRVGLDELVGGARVLLGLL